MALSGVAGAMRTDGRDAHPRRSTDFPLVEADSRFVLTPVFSPLLEFRDAVLEAKYRTDRGAQLAGAMEHTGRWGVPHR